MTEPTPPPWPARESALIECFPLGDDEQDADRVRSLLHDLGVPALVSWEAGGYLRVRLHVKNLDMVKQVLVSRLREEEPPPA